MPPVKENSERGRGGRPRDESRDQAILEAALALLSETGYDLLTIDAIAARAGAGKGAIYRRWTSKGALVVDAVNRASPHLTEPPNTGSLAGDMHALLDLGPEPPPGDEFQLMAGLASALPRDQDLRDSFRDHVMPVLTAPARKIYQRARERGEIPADRDLDLLTSIIPALIMYHLFMTGRFPDRAYSRRMIDEVVVPLATSPHRRTAMH